MSKISDKLNQMKAVDRFIDLRILGLSEWFGPAKKQEIYDWLVFRGFNIKTVILRMERLEIAGFIKTTMNYCLPVKRVLTNSAADKMMNEIIAELSPSGVTKP